MRTKNIVKKGHRVLMIFFAVVISFGLIISSTRISKAQLGVGIWGPFGGEIGYTKNCTCGFFSYGKAMEIGPPVSAKLIIIRGPGAELINFILAPFSLAFGDVDIRTKIYEYDRLITGNWALGISWPLYLPCTETEFVFAIPPFRCVQKDQRDAGWYTRFIGTSGVH